MRVPPLTRLVLSLAMLAGTAGSCGLLATQRYVGALLVIMATLALAATASYYYTARPITMATQRFAGQLDAIGFESLDDGQRESLQSLIDQSRLFGNQSVDIVVARGVRYGDVSVIWMQYLARRDLQLGFAWIAGFPAEFRARGRLVPTLTDDAATLTDAFDADTEILSEILPTMSLALQKTFLDNPCFCYEFQSHTLLADFNTTPTAFNRLRETYLDRGVGTFLNLLETLQQSETLFAREMELAGVGAGEDAQT